MWSLYYKFFKKVEFLKEIVCSADGGNDIPRNQEVEYMMTKLFRKSFVNAPGIRGQRAGFTLIEMAIVLVIIGIIIGAVMKGRDLIKSAQIKNAYETFFAAHYKIITAYYDKTGKILADGTINGGTGATPNG